ncbi:MAG TPA: hypothetical protein VH481_10555 [Nitrososphaeraceae archaeon]
MKCRKITSLCIASILIAILGSASVLIATSQYSSAQESQEKSTVVRDSQTIILEGKTIPAKDYIHLYDTTPYMIMVGHVAVKLPCDSKSESPYKILIGQAPNLVPAEFELIKELSKPGQMCLYHVDVESTMQGEHGIITDIALQNPTDKEVKFGQTATVVIGVDEIMPGAEEGGAMGNMTMNGGNMTINNEG